jgi:hypothetical protein
MAASEFVISLLRPEDGGRMFLLTAASSTSRIIRMLRAVSFCGHGGKC